MDKVMDINGDKAAKAAPPNASVIGINADVGMKDDIPKAGATEKKPAAGGKAGDKNTNGDAVMDNVNGVNDSKAPIVGARTPIEKKADVDENKADVCMSDKKDVRSASLSTESASASTDATVPVNPVKGASDVGNNVANGAASPPPKPYSGPPPNAEIQVLWEITAEDGSVEVTWWKAVIQGSEFVDGKRIAILLYDSHGEFDEEVVRVRFTSATELVDISREGESGGGVLEWRLYDPSRKDDSGVITSGELAEGGMETESRVMYDAGMQALGTMSAQQQVEFAAQYRSFADQLKNALKDLAESGGADYVVTKEDMEAVIAKLRKEQGE